MKPLKQFKKVGDILIKWFTRILSAFENHPKTSIGIFILMFSLITGETGLPLIAGIFETIKGLLKTK
ncbi:hypothetical protein [uncultured Arcticibacterium sp.]|uniref:hypothetical protein n=1 Tax=uncultured Arcticibacterium sp. TaxID=2173042 RepID=UPI0030F557D2